MTPSKKELRQLAKATLSKLSDTDRKQRSATLVQKIADQIKSGYPQATRIGIYSALPHEPDLSLLHILLPNVQFHYPLVTDPETIEFHHVSDPENLEKGAFGVKEPKPMSHPPLAASDLHLILVPGLAFDLQGNRLGHGAGYYDRLLAEIPQTPRIGVSFSSQHLPELPNEPHDMAMNLLVSERGSLPVG